MNIGQVAKRSGVSAKMIRYYEQIGLMREVRRSEAGYGLYSDADIQMLQFIHRAREFGFRIERIRRLVNLWQGHSASCDVISVALEQVSELERRIVELVVMRDSLKQLVALCPGDHDLECPILHELACLPRLSAGSRTAYSESPPETSDFLESPS